jgi:hypothetical protein
VNPQRNKTQYTSSNGAPSKKTAGISKTEDSLRIDDLDEDFRSDGHMTIADRNASTSLTGEVCQFFLNEGWCRNGDSCKHAHIRGTSTFGMSMRAVLESFEKQEECIAELRKVLPQPGDNRDCLHALDVCMKRGWGKAANIVIRRMYDGGLEADAVDFCAAIQASSKEGACERALQKLQLMKTRGVQPTVSCLTAAMMACAQMGQRDKVVPLLQEIAEHEFKYSVFAFASAFDATSRVRWEQAYEVFSVLEHEHTYTRLVKCFMAAVRISGKYGRGLGVVTKRLLRAAERTNEIPDARAYNCLLGSCVKTNEWWQGQQLATEMQNLGIEIDPAFELALNRKVIECDKASVHRRARGATARDQQRPLQKTRNSAGD